jgi:hypothetical protein
MKRVPAVLGAQRAHYFLSKRREAEGSGTTAYAWYVWDKNAPGSTELKWFEPGYKAKFS